MVFAYSVQAHHVKNVKNNVKQPEIKRKEVYITLPKQDNYKG